MRSLNFRSFVSALQVPVLAIGMLFASGCFKLRDWLKEPKEKAPWTAWVSDHRTKEFVPAATAVFTKSPTVQTPMNSGILAWADAASRDQDPAAAGGTPVAPADVLGPLLAGKAP